jgi:hypothetical protein
LAIGPDGNPWFTTGPAMVIGRMSPTGVFTTFPTADSAFLREPHVAVRAGNDVLRGSGCALFSQQCVDAMDSRRAPKDLAGAGQLGSLRTGDRVIHDRQVPAAWALCDRVELDGDLDCSSGFYGVHRLHCRRRR